MPAIFTLVALISGFIFATLLVVGCKMDTDLIDAILSNYKLGKFESRDVSQIVSNYIPIGTERQEAIDYLKRQGFDVSEEKLKLPECLSCDPLVIIGHHWEKDTIPFLPYKSSISILLGCNGKKVVHIAALHSANPY
jgi:hypothetical protein